VQISDKESANNFTLAPVLCPDCGSPMRLAVVAPRLSVPDTGEVYYRCVGCNIELRRIAKTA
jgi:DNA-directed RNA polymerase subunit RPC12/RpoP